MNAVGTTAIGIETTAGCNAYDSIRSIAFAPPSPVTTDYVSRPIRDLRLCWNGMGRSKPRVSLLSPS